VAAQACSDEGSETKGAGSPSGAGAAGSGGSPGSGGSGGGVGDGSVAALQTALEARGLSVNAGKFAFIDLSKCCELPSCYGNNPSSRYGAAYLPPASNQTAKNPGVADDGDLQGLSSAWRLGATEAVVLLGRTPPQGAYFGFTPYLFDRDDGKPKRTTYF